MEARFQRGRPASSPPYPRQRLQAGGRCRPETPLHCTENASFPCSRTADAGNFLGETDTTGRMPKPRFLCSYISDAAVFQMRGSPKRRQSVFADLEPWWRLGCLDLRIPVLAAWTDRLLGDDAALRIDEPGGLTTPAATHLRELVPRLHDLWDELAAIPIPASIVQQDFRHGNLVMSGRSYVFYDWSDTVVSHPFFACCRFLDFVQRGPHPRRGLPVEERSRRIADAYLQPSTSILGHADLP